MIQTSAPTLNAASVQMAGAPASAAASGAGFAALLDITQVAADAAPEPTLPTGEVAVVQITASTLPDAVKGARDGLAALTLQADAALPPIPAPSFSAPSVSAPVPASPVPAAPARTPLAGAKPLRDQAAPNPGQQPGAPSGKAEIPVLPPVAPIAPSAALAMGLEAFRGAAATMSATAPAENVTAPSALPVPSETATPAPEVQVPAAAIVAAPARAAHLPASPLPADLTAPKPAHAPMETAAPLDGKSGKPSGKILPPSAEPARRKHSEEAPASIKAATETAAASPPPVTAQPVAAIPDAPSSPAEPAALPIAPFVASASVREQATAAPAPAAAPAMAQAKTQRPSSLAALEAPSATPPSPTVPLSPAAPRQVDMPGLEPIEIVAAEPAPVALSPAPSLTAPTPVPPRPAEAAPLVQERTVTAAAAPHAETIAQPAGGPAQQAGNSPAPVIQAQTSQLPPVIAPRIDQAPAAAQEAPIAAPTPDAVIAASVDQPRAAVSARTAQAQPAASPHRAAPASEIDAAPASARTASAPQPPQPLITEAAPVIPPATASAIASAPTAETPQDFATLVSRLSEAREAASPHVVRTALSHAEFGRVSMQIAHDDGGLSVTMASRDPEFTGAVQAAAAAAANSGAGNGEPPRQENAGQQQASAGQNAASTNAGTGGGQGQQARTDASGQQARREGGAFARPQEQRQPGASARETGERRPAGGLYA